MTDWHEEKIDIRKVPGAIVPPSVVDRIVDEVMRELTATTDVPFDANFVKRILLIHLAIEDALRREGRHD